MTFPEERLITAETVPVTRVVGQSLPRVDGPSKATGATRFGSDIDLPNTLVGKVLRSPHAHAKIVAIDTSKAAALQGVHAVITAADTPCHTFGYQSIKDPKLADKMALERDKVRYIGDEVAAVAAETEDIAIAALDLIDVEYDVLPAVFTPDQATAKGAPLVHESVADNLINEFEYSFGDVDAVDMAGLTVVEGSFYTSPTTAASMETHQSLAYWSPEGRLTVHASTQKPFPLRAELAKALGIHETKIRIVKEFMGGGFGSRIDMHAPDPICAFLAQKTGTPVKMVYSRTEEFLATRTRHPFWMEARLAADPEGTIVLFDMSIVQDAGAYVSLSMGTARVGAVDAMTMYALPNARVPGRIVHTNNPYASANRGYGAPQTNFAIESLVSELAAALGIDEVDLRLKNAHHAPTVTGLGNPLESCGYTEALSAAADASGWHELRGQRRRDDRYVRGLGVATGMNVAGGARDQGDSDASGALVLLRDDGYVALNTGGQEIGSGGNTVFCQIAAEELGVTPDRVVVHNSDTDTMPWDIGCHAQRNVFCVGNAVLLACQDARRQLEGEIERVHGLGGTDVELRDNAVWRRSTDERLASIEDVVRGGHFRQGGRTIIGQGFYDPPTGATDAQGHGIKTMAYSFAAQVAEVEVDLATGKVEVISVTSASDVGKAINPMGIEAQVDGGVAHGIGQALWEVLRVENGQILNPNFLNYKTAIAPDIPRTTSIIVEDYEPNGPFGAKGVAEVTIVPTMAAIANAIKDATGIRLRRIPLDAESLYRELVEAGIAYVP